MSSFFRRISIKYEHFCCEYCGDDCYLGFCAEFVTLLVVVVVVAAVVIVVVAVVVAVVVVVLI